MKGLVLQGGGVRGAYQAGAYQAFKENHFHFDGVTGTSIGSFNAAMIATKKHYELLRFWQTADIGKILELDETYTKKLKEKTVDFEYVKLTIKNVFNIIKNHGLNTTGLESVLKSSFTPKELLNSKMDFGLCTVRLNDLKPLYVFKENMTEDNIYDYIMASCYLPIFKTEKIIDDKYYIDGGFYDNTPINMLIDKGYKKIYVVSLNPLININKKPKKDVEIIKIAPIRSLGWVLSFNEEDINEYIKMGYYDTLRVIKKLDGYNYCFKKYALFFYNLITRKVSKKELQRVMNFFNVHSKKEVVIKSLEYIMQRENINYYKVYKPYKIIKKIKNNYKRDHFIYNFVRKLNIL